MTKPVANLTARIRKLRDARERAAKLKRGTVLIGEAEGGMAELLGVRWVTLRGWVDDMPSLEEKGAVVRGGNGIKWQFKPVKTIDLLLAHFEREQNASAAKAKRVRQIALGPGADLVDEGLSLDDMAKVLKLSMQFQEQRERQRELVDAKQVQTSLQVLFAQMQQAGMRATQEADPNGRWSPEIRSIVEDVARSILLNQERAARKCLATLAGG